MTDQKTEFQKAEIHILEVARVKYCQCIAPNFAFGHPEKCFNCGEQHESQATITHALMAGLPYPDEYKFIKELERIAVGDNVIVTLVLTTEQAMMKLINADLPSRKLAYYRAREVD